MFDTFSYQTSRQLKIGMSDINSRLKKKKQNETNLLFGVECLEFLQILSDRAETFNSIRFFWI